MTPRAEPLAQLVLAIDVVRVPVRPQDVRRRQALLALDELEQRLERGTAVDEDRGATGLVGEDVGVRQPDVVHGALDQHDGRAYSP